MKIIRDPEKVVFLSAIVAYLNGEDQDTHTIAEAAIDFEVSKAAIEQALWREGYRVQTRWVKLSAEAQAKGEGR